jgi:hypothetical protein
LQLWGNFCTLDFGDQPAQSRALVNRRGRKQGERAHKEVFPLLKAAPVNFVGNIEGRDVFRGDVTSLFAMVLLKCGIETG